ncbi:MAG: V-type ATP synthase subunit D [Candidatus Brocadiaceae bacterium]
MAMRDTLLKDKNEGLMKEFMTLIKAYKEARFKKWIRSFQKCLQLFVLCRITFFFETISEAPEQSPDAEMRISGKNILNVKVPGV